MLIENVGIKLPLDKTSKLIEELCKILVRTGAIKFGLFKLTSGILSPYYIDMRTIPSFPNAFKTITSIYEMIIKEKIGLKSFDRIGSVPTAGIPYASVLSFRLDKPLLYVRKEVKMHGRERKIEGLLEPGDKVLLIDDLITTGKNLVSAVNAVRGEGGIIEKGLVLIDRQEGGIKQLRKMNVEINFFIRVSDLAKKLFDINVLDERKYEEIIKQIKNRKMSK
jgi:orotate phosphoribosyltransferase